MPTYYFQSKESEFCYSAEYFQNEMLENSLAEMTVFKAVPEQVPGAFFCQSFGLVSEIGHCGRACKSYEPKNGKWGICRHFGSLYSPGYEVTLKRNEL